MSLNANVSIRLAGPTADAASGASGHLSAEIDDRADGLNGGKTSFAPGDTVYFLVFRSPDVMIVSVTATAGTIQPATVGPVEKAIDVQFINTDAAAVPLPATSLVDYAWYGRSLGNLTLTADNTLQASAVGVGVASATLLTQPIAFALVTPALTLEEDESYPIIVYIQGEYGTSDCAPGMMCTPGLAGTRQL